MPCTVRLLGAVRVSPRYRAPAGDGEFLAVPPLTELAARFAENSVSLNSSAIHIGLVPLGDFRRNAVQEVLEASNDYLFLEGIAPVTSEPRLVVAGHQPEFFHPGVWVKNFALNGLAATHGYSPLNLVVDNDTVKSTSIRLPISSGDSHSVEYGSIAFDESPGEVPYEEHRQPSRTLFDSFPERVGEAIPGWGFQPILHQCWPRLLVDLNRGTALWEATCRLRRTLERHWGVRNFELPVSRLAETRAFEAFVTALMNDLPHFVACYNEAIREYRSLHRLRSANHPAPKLEETGNWLEAPFWIWHGDLPTRQRLWARKIEGGIEFQAGDRVLGSQSLAKLRSAGWKIRPRALTLTMFVRLCLADGFIHGIGGGKYDEVTDAIIQRYFNIEPPDYGVVSATLRLRLPRFEATKESERRAQRRLRDLEWNPQEEEEVQAAMPKLVERKRELIAREPERKAERRAWFRELHQVTVRMRELLAARIDQARLRKGRVRSEIEANEILGSREYAWLLFPELRLRTFFTKFVNDGLTLKE